MLTLLAAALMTSSPPDRPLLIAHRGASAERPEHTLEAYARAIELGADYIEPDLVATKDGHLIARHESELSGTTDVADRSEFADRRTTKTIDGREVTGWFAEDFTLAEIRTLRAKERLPEARPANTAFDGQFAVPTFEEIVALARGASAQAGRTIGVYPELKHPSFLAAQGIDVTALMVDALRRLDLDDADDPIFVQCFEVGPLRRLDAMVDTPLVQLIAAQGGPADLMSLSYAEMATSSGLADIATYADGVGVAVRLLVAKDGSASSLVRDAHAEGLLVHGWTLRAENAFLPDTFRSSDNPAAIGDYIAVWGPFIATGADGFFIDNLAEWNALQSPASANPSAPSPAE